MRVFWGHVEHLQHLAQVALKALERDDDRGRGEELVHRLLNKAIESFDHIVAIADSPEEKAEVERCRGQLTLVVKRFETQSRAEYNDGGRFPRARGQ
jgi:hypothetical protein